MPYTSNGEAETTDGMFPELRLMVDAMKASGVKELLGLFCGNGKGGFELCAPVCMLLSMPKLVDGDAASKT